MSMVFHSKVKFEIFSHRTFEPERICGERLSDSFCMGRIQLSVGEQPGNGGGEP